MVLEILSSVRTISHLLHPPLLDETGLPPALRWYVEEFAERSGIKVVLVCPAHLKRLPSELETAIFRIVQECLGNVHRHSGSATATVYFDVADDMARLEVRDEGKGISSERRQQVESGSGGVGLRGIKERIAQFGGKLELQSNSMGTSVVATIPSNPTAANRGINVA